MPASISTPRCEPPPFDRLTAQIGVAHELALDGRAAPARRLCGALFLDHLVLIMRDRPLLQSYVECLLLLEMTALLPRVLRAVFGVDLEMARCEGSRPSKWKLSFGNGITLLILAPGSGADRAAQEHNAALWARRILDIAAEDGVELAAPVDRADVLERSEAAISRRANWSVTAGFGAER